MAAGTLLEDLGCYNSDVVDLSISSQDSVILNICKDGMELGTVHCLATQDPGDLFQYGPRQGNLELRQSLANFLAEEYGHQVSSERLFITGGSSQGLVLLCNVLSQSGDPVFVPDLTGSSLDIFRDLSLKLVSVPTDENGLIVEELDKLLKAHSYRKRSATEKKPFWGFVYLMTIFKNPTGQSLPEDRCNALIEIIRKHKVLCLCDDTLACLSYAESDPAFKKIPKRLFAYDQRFVDIYRSLNPL